METAIVRCEEGGDDVMRPRYNGYLYFQDHAGDYVRDYVMNGGNAGNVLDQLNALYRKSREGK